MVYFKKIAYSGKYQDDNAIPLLLAYISQPSKTPHHILDGFWFGDNNAAESMIAVSNHFGKNSKIRLHHFVLSFEPYLNHSYQLIYDIAYVIAEEISKNYQIVFAAHEDTNNIHIHFVFNAVSYVTGLKYHGGKTEYKELYQLCYEVIKQAQLLPLVAVSYHPNSIDLEKSHE